MGGKLGEVQAGKAGFMSLAQGFRLYTVGKEVPQRFYKGSNTIRLFFQEKPLAAVRTIAKKRETSERETDDMAISKPGARLA